MLGDPLVSYSFGRWFSRVFTLFGANFTRLIPFSAASVAIFGILAIGAKGEVQFFRLMLEGNDDDASSYNLTVYSDTLANLVGVLPMLVLSAFFFCASFFFVIRAANGRTREFGTALRFALRRVWPLLGWGVLGGLLVWSPVLSFAHDRLFVRWFSGRARLRVGRRRRVTVARCDSLFFADRRGDRGAGHRDPLFRFGPGIVLGQLRPAVRRGSDSPVLSGVNGWATSLIFTSGSSLYYVVHGVLSIPFETLVVVVCVATYAGLRRREDQAVNTYTLDAELRS